MSEIISRRTLSTLRSATLTPNRENDLVYDFTNMRLQKRYRVLDSFAELDKGQEMTKEEKEAVE